MRVLVCGDRDWGGKSGDLSIMYRRLNKLPKEDLVIIEGEAPGADSMARDWAFDVFAGQAHDRVLRFPAQWKQYGRAAGPIRNRQMLMEGQPDLVLAFHHDIEGSKGTKDMVAQARKAGVPVEVIE